MILELTADEISWIKGRLSELSTERYVKRSNSDSEEEKAAYIEAQTFDSTFKQNLSEIDPSNEAEEDLESSRIADLSFDEFSWIRNELARSPALLAIKASESRSAGERDFYIEAQIFIATFYKKIDEINPTDSSSGLRASSIANPIRRKAILG